MNQSTPDATLRKLYIKTAITWALLVAFQNRKEKS